MSTTDLTANAPVMTVSSSTSELYYVTYRYSESPMIDPDKVTYFYYYPQAGVLDLPER